MAEWADRGIKRAVPQLLLPSFIDGMKLLKELSVSSFSLVAGVSHLSQLLDELANTRADFERTAFFESGQLPARPLHSVTRTAYGHMALPKAGQLNITSFKVTSMGVLRKIIINNMCNNLNLSE